MKKNIVKKGKGSVYGGEALWEQLNSVIKQVAPSKIVVITDYNTKKHCVPILLRYVSKIPLSHIITIPVGEQHKTITTCLDLWKQLSSIGMDRNGLIINLGGGVVTDLGGFVASTFQRGVCFVNIPTTLLAMVDAAVGGKTGVDLAGVKNQIGVIQNAEGVFVDTTFLKTLPKDEFISGMAEMIKHGFITSKEYLNKCLNLNRNNPKEIEELVWESIKIKNSVITKDPYEQGLRKTLNYGHTLGHAIESHCLKAPERKTLLHGEAIAIGMILANYISSVQLGFSKKILHNTSQEIITIFGKETFSESDIEKIIKLLAFDKKNSNGNINFVLLSEIGTHAINCKVENDLIFKAFHFYETI